MTVVGRQVIFHEGKVIFQGGTAMIERAMSGVRSDI